MRRTVRPIEEVGRLDDMKRAWDEVGDGFSTLGRMISERYREQGGEGDTPAGTDGEGDTPAGTPQGNAVADAVRRATEELDRAMTSLGDTLRDDAARQQMRDTGRKLTDALKVTFNEVADEIRHTVGGNRPSGQDGPPPNPDEPAPPGTSA